MKKLLNKKSIIITAVVVLLACSGIAVTMAYIADRPEQMVNTFEVGNVTTAIKEDVFVAKTNTTFSKEPVVVNTGANDCYVRARVVCSPESALELKNISTDWTYNAEDGFYYYSKALAGTSENGTGESSAPIFTEVEVIDTTIDGFEVTVYQEAVQTVVYAADGTSTTDQTEIWECFETGIVPGTFAAD